MVGLSSLVCQWSHLFVNGAFENPLLLAFLRLLFPQLNFISCLAISACLTPTDPIICSAIVGEFLHIYLICMLSVNSFHQGGKFARDNVPDELRHILSAESAANDGLAYPFLTLSIYLSLDSSSGLAITHWILIGCLCMLSVDF